MTTGSSKTALGLAADRRMFKHLLNARGNSSVQKHSQENMLARSDSISSSVAQFPVDNPLARKTLFNLVINVMRFDFHVCHVFM